MRVSAELRWFYEGDVPDDVAAWFRELGPHVEVQAPRVDRYLRPAGQALNVKLREASVELKRRESENRIVSVGPSARGRLERWTKWSFLLQAHGGEDASGASWIAVRKRRRMRCWVPTATASWRGITEKAVRRSVSSSCPAWTSPAAAGGAFVSSPAPTSGGSSICS